MAVSSVASRLRGLAWLLLGLTALAAAGAWSWAGLEQSRRASLYVQKLQPALPHLGGVTAHVTSDRCQACHPHEHASWHRTYHRTMTQVALPENVLGNFDNSTVLSDGLAYRVFKEGAEFWAEMPDPDVMMYVAQGGKKLALKDIPRTRARVVMATGSHHYQTYWVASPRYDRLLQTLPLVYLKSDRRWIPRAAAFMRPPGDADRFITQWNHHCIRCHSTAGNPGLDQKSGMLDTRVAELGIACEACHGPAEEHVRRHQNPVHRYAQHFRGGPDPSIVNPARLDHRRSSEVCGQCHGVFIFRDEFAMQSASQGPLYHAGEDLHRARYYIQHPAREPSPVRAEELQKNPDFFRERWWDDGTILAGGREYTALAVSGCYKRGKISCLSCHSMHDSDPVDQLKTGMQGNAACTQCHQEPKFTRDLATHTFHAATSPGSECMNCHMPYSTYALLGGIRSHQIESPTIAGSARYGTPNACNLCHLDRTLAWTQQYLRERYQQPTQTLSEAQQTVSAAVLWLLSGHAAQRVIAAWHAGWAPAQQASGDDWLAPIQARLLEDPYGVVRYVAADALRSMPGFKDFSYDFLAGPAELKRSREQAVQQWRERPAPRHTGRAILLQDDGRLMESAVEELLRQRDNRRVIIKE
jgi:predicted CXXCH cytochrome family protein